VFDGDQALLSGYRPPTLNGTEQTGRGFSRYSFETYFAADALFALRPFFTLGARGSSGSSGAACSGCTGLARVALELLEHLRVDLLGRVDQVAVGGHRPAAHREHERERGGDIGVGETFAHQYPP